MPNVGLQRAEARFTASLLSTPSEGHHLVTFYEDEPHFLDVVGSFLRAGLEAGDGLVVMATPAHRDALVRGLQGCAVEHALDSGQLLLLDAQETLNQFMVKDWPDSARFHRVLDEALLRVGRPREGASIRAFGEMVDLLWRDGKRAAAVALEELWNEAAARHAFSLLCAYTIANFYKGGEGASFGDVCRTHSHVLPVPNVSRRDDPSMMDGEIDVYLLRQQLTLLQHEVNHLREREGALRESSSEQRRLAQEALLASETRFHHLVDAITEYAIFLLDAGGHVVTWNPGASRIKGYSQEEILGSHFSVFYTAEDRAAGKPGLILDAVRRTGRFEDESWRVRKDGSRFWANVVITALVDQHGNVTGFAKVTRDLTARREAEERERQLAREQAARAASERASRDLERLNRVGALFIADPSSMEPVLLEIVDAAIAIAGADFGNIQLLGDDGSLHIVAHRGFPAWWLDFWSAAGAGQGSCAAALGRAERVMVEDVERSPIFVGSPALDVQLRADVRAVVSTPITSRSGAALGMFSTHYRAPTRPDERTLRMLDMLALQAADILDRVRADAANAAVREQLERADRAKDEFVATLSHELRTPLNAMLGWASLLRQDHSDPTKLARGLEVIERNAKTQTHLVSDLLDMSRIISGKLRLTLKKTAPSGAIIAAADVVRPAADAKGVRLVLDLHPDVGTTIADPDRLQQVVWNLLINAIRFTPAGGCVTVTARRDGPMITIRVQDTGAGIAAQDLPYIFERFRQVDSSSTRKHQGLGLGLAIVRHLVEAHGGSVTAASDGLRRGAAFTIVLPIPAVSVAEREATTEQDSVAAAVASSAPMDLSHVHALVVDDNADSLELVRFVLEGAGARVTAVADARAALRAPGPFDIILSDIEMPEMDGYTLLRNFRRDVGGTTPAIALTAYARAVDASRAFDAGYQEHLGKPVDAAALVDAVARLTRRDVSDQVRSAP